MKPIELDQEFINIINADTTTEELINGIKYLQKAMVLNETEKQFCSRMFEQLEMFGYLDYNQICKDMRISNYQGEQKSTYNNIELTNKLDEFIKARKAFVIDKMMLGATEDGIDGLTKSLTQLFFERYSKIIEVKEDKETFNQLENVDNNSQIDISSAVEIIDNLIYGLKGGTITSILGGANDAKSLWAINIAYMALTKNKNVLFISIGCTKRDVFLRLLSRHSCNSDKFEKEFSFNECLTDYDKNNYKIIYNDFKNNYLQNIIVYDESEFIISTHYNLQKLIVNAQSQFINENGNGIDLIVIDDFSFMKLDIGHKCITNQNSVVEEYYSYLKDQAQNLLGTRNKIPIVITISPNQITKFFDTTSIYQATSNSVKMLSDNIFIAYGDSELIKRNKLIINVMQSYCKKNLEQTKTVNVNYSYWYLEYDKYSNISSKILLEEERQEKEELKNELEDIKEEYNNLLLNVDSSSNDNLKITFD